MTEPLIIDVPHKLGREEAKRRMRARIGELPAMIPGGFADVKASWPSDDAMALDIKAMGQSVSAKLDVREAVIQVSVVLPPSLGFFSGAIRKAIQKKGGELLLGDESKKV